MPNITGDQLTFNIDSISDNQILVYDGSSGIFVAQDSLSSNANAAVASASNVGASGVGVFKEKDGSVLKFKNIAPGTNTTVTEDVANGLIKVNATQYSPTAPFQLHNNNGNVFVAQGQNYGANANVAGFIGVQSSNSYGTYSDSTTFDGHTRFRLGSNDLVDVELTSAHGLILSTAQNSDGHIQLRSNTNIEFYAQGSLTTNPDLEITGAGALKIGNSFTMPTADGTSDQVLSTYGNGVVHWKTITVPSFTESSILAKTVRLDQTSVPTVTNSYDIGSTTRQFYEVHANYFKGQADTAIQIYNNTNGTVLDDSYILGLATNSSNLSGLTDAGVARTNLGVYSKAEANALVSGATQTNSFVRLTDGTNTASAANTNDVFTITGGNDITATINAGTKTLTIDSTATPQNAFKHVFVSGQNTISADSSADGLTFAAGSGIQITTDEGTDTITITNSGGGGGGGATEAFKNIAVSGQTTIVADASADTVTFVAGTGMTITTDDANDSVTFNSSGSFTTSDVDAHLNQSNPTSGYVLSWNGSDYAWVSNAGYTDADVDTHLNQSGASASQVLSWNGSDYAWVAQSGGVALTDLSVTTASASGGGTLSYNNSTGAFTFAPADLTGYQTTAGLDAGINTHLNQSTAASGEVLSWNGSDYDWIAQTDAQALTYDSGTGNLSISGGNTVDLSSLLDNVDAQVLSISGNTISLTGQSGNVDLTSLLVAGNYDNADVDAHLNQSNPTSGYVLSWNGSDYAWVDNAGFTNTDVDSHLNQSNPTSGYVLSWNGSDYAWVAQTSSYGDSDVGTYLTAQGFDTKTNIIAEITDSAPATLDTLNELAAALGDDPNFATTTTTSLGNRLRIDVNNQNLSTSEKSNAVTNLGLHTVASSGAYSDLSGTPTLATVATSGVFTDLTSRPTITLSGNDLTYDGTTIDLTSVGATGPQGNTGAQGPQGAQGDTGDTGTTGIGITSTALVSSNLTITYSNSSVQDLGNVRGPVGPQGIQGPQGNVGATGPAGSNGSDGADGADSTVAGPQGPQGATGVSVSSAALSGDNLTLTLSNSTVLTAGNVRGPVGPTGAQGPQGDAGNDGAAGAVDQTLSASGNVITISGNNDTVDLTTMLAPYSKTDTDAQDLTISGNVISLTGQSGNVDLTSLLVAGNYDNADVDAHLNQSNPTSGYVLSWNGSDYAWVAQSGGGGSMSDVVDDTSPQLGGALDVNGQDIVSTSNGDIDLDPNGSGVVVFKGNATKGAGQFKLNCENNSHGITIKGPPHSAAASYTLTLPNNDGDADQVLKTDGSGGLSWVDQSGGGGGSVTRATHWEEFRVDYDSGDNSVSGNANVSAGISSIIFSGYDATIDFTGYDQPPLSIVLYGYDAQNNKYYVTHCDQNNRAQVAGNGSAGSPTAFTDFSSTTITVNVNLTNTGGQRDPGGFGQPAVASHTWVRFIMGD